MLFFFLPVVMFPEIMLGSFLRSEIAARGRPQLATGPQKCYRKRETVQLDCVLMYPHFFFFFFLNYFPNTKNLNLQYYIKLILLVSFYPRYVPLFLFYLIK